MELVCMGRKKIVRENGKDDVLSMMVLSFGISFVGACAGLGFTTLFTMLKFHYPSLNIFGGYLVGSLVSMMIILSYYAMKGRLR